MYFVRHAQPEHDWKEDRTRPLTKEGQKPYKRSMDTIADAAAFFGKEIITDKRLRERKKGSENYRLDAVYYRTGF